MTATVAAIVSALGVGGAGIAISRQHDLWVRWRTWALTASVVGAAFSLGHAGVVVLAAVVAAQAARELAAISALPPADRLVLPVLAAATVIVAPGAPQHVPVLALMGGLTALLTADVTGGLRRSAVSAFGVVWIGWPLSMLAELPARTAIALCFAVSVADVAGYVAGQALRGPRLSPLSPGKTWSGAAGAVLAGARCFAGRWSGRSRCGVTAGGARTSPWPSRSSRPAG
jgi:phosphatidate cytidylyltransferase